MSFKHPSCPHEDCKIMDVKSQVVPLETDGSVLQVNCGCGTGGCFRQGEEGHSLAAELIKAKAQVAESAKRKAEAKSSAK